MPDWAGTSAAPTGLRPCPGRPRLFPHRHSRKGKLRAKLSQCVACVRHSPAPANACGSVAPGAHNTRHAILLALCLFRRERPVVIGDGHAGHRLPRLHIKPGL